MKSLKPLLFLILVLFFSCSSDGNGGGNNLTNFKSQLCNNVVGPTAAYWDYANSLPIPQNQVPLLKNTNGQFIHSQLPYLGFPVPQGYSAFEDQNPQTSPIGVNVIRNDNNAIWRYVPLSSYPTNFDVTNVIANEINGMFSFFGFNSSNFEVVCSNTPAPIQEAGIVRSYSSRLIRFGNFTGLVWVTVTRVQGLPTISVASSVSAGPTAEFDTLVMDTFLPLSFQLLVNDRGSLSDRDKDGTPDIYDREPDNPNVQ